MKLTDELKVLFQIRKEGIWIKSDQEKELTAVVYNTLKESDVDNVFVFEPSSGLYKLGIDNHFNLTREALTNKNYPEVKNGTSGNAILSLYNYIQNNSEGLETSAVILKDMDLLYGNYAWSRVLREILEYRQAKYTPLVVISPTHQTNATLDHLFKELVYNGPEELDIKDLLKDYAEARHEEINADEVWKYFVGYNKREIIEILDESYARYDELNYSLLQEKKIAMIKSSGLLEYREPKVKMEDMGGNHRFKSWFEETKLCMTPEAREVGLDLPKGYLALGVPGCSKTLGAECIAADLNIPFLKLNMSSILTKFVGESERKITQARTLIEACAPCVLLIDEVEKALGGYLISRSITVI